MKTLVNAVLYTSILVSGLAMAEHELGQPKKAEIVQNTHLSWHEFRHELASYTQVQANMNHEGMVFLTGHTDSALEKSQVEKLARRIRGAVKVTSQISTD